ncbi:MAG: hypothetical protein M1828_004035 [Chrysothrix sp. TS-e1954]|nr:MAG: hypothetical protein M1828_004035 [Chrysothrix sp. TS-e1954]
MDEKPENVEARDNVAFQRALELHSAKLSSAERREFQTHANGGPDEILAKAKDFDAHHASKNVPRRCLARIGPFIRSTQQFFRVVGIFIQYDPEPSALIWGGILCALQMAIQFQAYFDKLLNVFDEVGDCLRTLLAYSVEFFPHHAVIQETLSDTYGTILDICRLAVSVFVDRNGRSRTGLRTFATLFWKSFEEQFGSLITQLRRQLSVLDDEALNEDRRVYRGSLARQEASQLQIVENMKTVNIHLESKNDAKHDWSTSTFAKIKTDIHENGILRLQDGLSVMRFTRVGLAQETRKSSGVAVNCSEQVYVVVDAIDEVQDFGVLCKLFQEISQSHQTVCKVFVTSRSDTLGSNLGLDRSDHVVFDPETVNHDINLYVKSEVRSLIEQERLLLSDPGLEQDIVQTVTQKADGMFLWAHLQIEDLCCQTNDKEIEQALQTLPNGLETVYARSFENIERLPFSRKRLAHKVLLWVLYAARRMSVDEVAEAVAVEIGSSALDPSNIVSRKHQLVMWTNSLVMIDVDNTIHTVHSSVQDYVFARLEAAVKPHDPYEQTLAQTEMARVCLTYLMYDQFDKPPSNAAEARQLLAEHRLLQYAVESWCTHTSQLQADDISVRHIVVDFLSTKSKFSSWRNIFCSMKSPVGELWDENLAPGIDIHPLISLTQLSLPRIAAGISIDDEATNVRDGFGRTLLMSAAGFGDTQLVRRLLDRGCDVHSADKAGFTALWFAAAAGNHDILRLLLDFGASPSGRGSDEIDRSIASSYAYIVRGIRHFTQKAYGEDSTALQIAAVGHRSCPPLFMSSSTSKHACVRALLKAGANVHAKDTFDKTALHYAVASGDGEVVNELLVAGADPQPRTSKSSSLSPLDLAVIFNKPLLLAKMMSASPEVDISAVLHKAATVGKQTIVERLVREGANVHALDIQRNTALHAAVKRNHVGIVKILVFAGVDLEIHNLQGKTALHEAACQSSVEPVEFLISVGADLGARTDLNSFNALHLAAENGNCEVIKCLLQHGFDPNARSRRGKTALLLAVEQEPLNSYDHLRSIKALVKAGTDLLAEDMSGRNCITVALGQLKEQVAWFLSMEENSQRLSHSDAMENTIAHTSKGNAMSKNLVSSIKLLRHLLRSVKYIWPSRVLGSIQDPPSKMLDIEIDRIFGIVEQEYRPPKLNVTTNTKLDVESFDSGQRRVVAYLQLLLICRGDISSFQISIRRWSFLSCSVCSRTQDCAFYRCATCSADVVCDAKCAAKQVSTPEGALSYGRCKEHELVVVEPENEMNEEELDRWRTDLAKSLLDFEELNAR